MNSETRELKNSRTVVVRFAPSPTGFLHIGGLRTALYNYLFARHNNGKFLLRIEDTDKTRYVEGAVEKLLEILNWCGLEYDEEPVIQSQRLDIYKCYIDNLLERRYAYRCFCTPERLEKSRKIQIARKQTPKYDGLCRKIPQIESDKLSEEKPFTVRMKIPLEEIKFTDIIRGEIKFDGALIDDQIILKSDGYPTYHLANVVDDHLMGITHIIRGEEWLSSTPKHILLYRYFGWTAPQVAHLPLLLNPDKSKLSKRQSDVAVEDYRDKGYLPDALLNYVALLGWSTEDSQQLFERAELIQKFSLERCGKSAAIFDTQKLLWMNGEYIRKMSVAHLAKCATEFLERKGVSITDSEFFQKCIALEQKKFNTLNDILQRVDFLLNDEYNTDTDAVKKILGIQGISGLIKELKEKIIQIKVYDAQELENLFRSFADEKKIKTSIIFHAIRVATSGRLEGPSLFHYLELLGKEKVVNRIAKFLERCH
ncbi:MAG: glutamate--tRNA ligase [Elusimicrobiota bacterium]